MKAFAEGRLASSQGDWSCLQRPHCFACAASVPLSRPLDGFSLLPKHRVGAGYARSNQQTPKGTQMETTKSDAIRPFSFHAPEAELTDLRKRINATR